MRRLFALGLLGFLGFAASCSSSEAPSQPEPFKSSAGGTGNSGAGGLSSGGAAAKAGGGGSGGAAIMCGAGQMSCSSKCVDTASDINNCGACAHVCAAGQICSAGACACNAGLKACGDLCVNAVSDPLNCGTCGTTCSGTTPLCSMSACSASCAGTETQCGNSCSDTKTDPVNCGFCNNPCAGGQSCVASVCTCPIAGQTTCGGQCVDTKTSAANCGSCMHACAATESCVNSVCMAGGVGGSAGGSSVGGSAGSGAGAGGASGSAGAPMGGSGGTGVIPPERNGCAITPGLIADFEEGGTTPVIIPSEDRTGEWETFNDGANTSEAITVESSGGTAMCDKYALHVKGANYASYAGFGFSLIGAPKSPTVYNATTHGFTGIRFKAKLGSTADSKSPVRFNVSTPFTESKDNPGGQCTPQAASTNAAAIDCYQHAGRFMPPGSGTGQLTQTFQTFTYCFDRDLYPLSLPSNLTTDQRNNIGASMLKVQFQFNVGKDYSGSYPSDSMYPVFASTLPFDFWLDQVEFFSGACPNTATSPSNGSPAKAFPQHAAMYGSACSTVPNPANYDAAIAQAYATWTSHFVSGSTIVAPEQSNAVTSEAMGYGMMIAAAMGDKTAFDKFYGYVKSNESGGLMNWKSGQSGSASDADIDIAYGLAMAGAQWGGSYASDASSMAGNITSKDIVSGIVRGGSSFQSANYNASYFIPVEMRKLGISLGGNYGFVNTNINAGAAKVPTDWANPSNGNPSGPGSAQVTSDITDGDNGAMGYDAARVPWRLGQDVCLGNSDGSSAVSAMVSYFAAKYKDPTGNAGGHIDQMKAGWYKAKDAPHTAAKDSQGSFIGPMGVAGMAAKNNYMRDSAFRAMLDIMESGDFNHTYFPSTIGLITMLIMSGNFPTP